MTEKKTYEAIPADFYTAILVSADVRQRPKYEGGKATDKTVDYIATRHKIVEGPHENRVVFGTMYMTGGAAQYTKEQLVGLSKAVIGAEGIECAECVPTRIRVTQETGKDGKVRNDMAGIWELKSTGGKKAPGDAPPPNALSNILTQLRGGAVEADGPEV